MAEADSQVAAETERLVVFKDSVADPTGAARGLAARSGAVPAGCRGASSSASMRLLKARSKVTSNGLGM